MISVPKAGKMKMVEQIFKQNEDKICRKLLPRRKEPEEYGDDGERGVIYIYIYIYREREREREIGGASAHKNIDFLEFVDGRKTFFDGKNIVTMLWRPEVVLGCDGKNIVTVLWRPEVVLGCDGD